MKYFVFAAGGNIPIKEHNTFESAYLEATRINEKDKCETSVFKGNMSLTVAGKNSFQFKNKIKMLGEKLNNEKSDNKKLKEHINKIIDIASEVATKELQHEKMKIVSLKDALSNIAIEYKDKNKPLYNYVEAVLACDEMKNNLHAYSLFN